ncbi:MAG TPA: DUF2813 domain-containing protein [Paludibaculum sp.]|jgi:putative ATP-dependent endonuclease of OLD family
MRVAEFTVEQFRGIERATLRLDATTVLIGENDCGRSSLLEALALALGWKAPPGEFHFEAWHFRRGAQQPIRIRVSFVESFEGEWEQAACGPLRDALPHALLAPRGFFLEVRATPEGVSSRFATANSTVEVRDDRELLRWLNRRLPILRMGSGVVESMRSLGAAAQRPADEPASDLVERVEQHYRTLLLGNSMDPTGELEAGYQAAAELLKSSPESLDLAASPLAHSRRAAPLLHGTAAQKIGTLLLVGAMLHGSEQEGDYGALPLMLIDDPEAHLHPMTLASIWAILDRVSGQKVIGTHSGILLSAAPVHQLRRLTRAGGVVTEWRVPEGSLGADDLRRFSYHLRSRRGAAMFARCWLMVEGETEFWLLGELARLCGYDFATEGIVCVEFAQCGLAPLLRVAGHLGIEWHLLTDGDQAGETYAGGAAQFVRRGEDELRLTMLEDRDIEHCFWRYGYANVFRQAAGKPQSASFRPNARAIISRAIERHSKPWMAMQLLEAAAPRGKGGVPPPLRQAIETCVQLARCGGRSAAECETLEGGAIS